MIEDQFLSAHLVYVCVFNSCFNAMSFSVVVVTRTTCDDQVSVVSRAEWGARPPRTEPVNISIPVNMTFIHHSDKPWRGTTLAECIRQVQSIQNFHMFFRGTKLVLDL